MGQGQIKKLMDLPQEQPNQSKAINIQDQEGDQLNDGSLFSFNFLNEEKDPKPQKKEEISQENYIS